MVRIGSIEIDQSSIPFLPFHDFRSVSTYYDIAAVRGFFVEELPKNRSTLPQEQVKELNLDNAARSHCPLFKDPVEKHAGWNLASADDVFKIHL